MTEDLKTDLKNLMITADKRSRPILPYHTMTPEEFVTAWFYGRFVEIFSVGLIKLGADRSWPNKSEWLECAELSGALDDRIILALAQRYYEPALFWVIAERMCEQTYIMEELVRRTEGKEIVKNLLVLPVALNFAPDSSRIEKLLRVDKLKPFVTRENEYEASDVKQLGLAKVAEMVHAAREMNPISLPPYPLKLHPEIQNAWDGWMAEAWRQGMEKAFREIKAGLSLNDEAIRQKAREPIRNLFDTTTRRKEIYETHEEQIRSEIHPDADEKLSAAPDISTKTFGVLRAAKKRWGAKAVKALLFLLEGKTEEEAAKLAGITSRTLRNYKAKLTTEFSLKK